jgi:4-hydroxy-tetrahydrodipicolinate synthase
MVALVTPMTASGSIDWAALDKLVEWHVEQGTHAIVAVGTTGESATLNVNEHCQVINRVVSAVAGAISIIAGTGANSTAEAIELTEAAKSARADACLLVTPYYNKPTQEGLYQHHKAIAEAVDIPQILYNVPGRTACDMSNDTVDRLADIESIIGIKDATGDLQRGAELIRRCEGRIAVYSGDDPTAMDLILAGAKGNISVTANIAPKMMSQLCVAALAGDKKVAEAINERLMPLNNHLFLESNPIPVKWALNTMGLIAEGIRLPLTQFDSQYHATLRSSMEQAGIL